jgi:hypothetical protein
MIGKLLSRSCSALVALGGVALFGAVGCGGDDDASGSFPLREGTQVTMRLAGVQAPEGVSVTYKLGEDLLTEPGDTAVIGVAIEDLHVHGEWSVTIPAELDPDDLMLGLSFTLASPSGIYQESSEIMAYLGFHHDDHEGEDDHEGDDDQDEGGAILMPRGSSLGAREPAVSQKLTSPPWSSRCGGRRPSGAQPGLVGGDGGDRLAERMASTASPRPSAASARSSAWPRRRRRRRARPAPRAGPGRARWSTQLEPADVGLPERAHRPRHLAVALRRPAARAAAGSRASASTRRCRR